jgi:L-threonylcarbamoyladenylate synthase
MKTSVVEQSNPQSAEIAREVLLAGGVIAIPTDTVYGIACLVKKRESIQRLYAIKERELMKAIPVLIGTLEQISSITDSFSSSANILSQHFWPGALTLVINKHPDLPFELTSYPTVGLSDRVALLIDGGTCAGGIPSTVIDCTFSPVKILREGGISEPAIRRVLEDC